MKTLYPSFLVFLIVLGFSNPAFPIENRTNDEAAQNVQSFRTMKELVGRLGQKETLQDIESIFPAADKGLNKLVLPLLEKKMPPPPRMGGVPHALELGFDTGTKNAKVRPTPFPIFETTLNDLRNFTPGKEATTLLTYTHQLLFPVEVNSQVKSSVTIRFAPDTPGKTEDKETGWRLTRWGQPKLIGLLIKAKASQKQTIQSSFLLKIPALNRNFLGCDDNGVIRLIPLVDDHLFTAGEAYLAHDVFKWLSTEARSVDDSPR